MASSFALLALVVAAFTLTVVESRALPAPEDWPMPLVMDMFDEPLVFVRGKRATYRPYPQRTMLFTGFYRPARHSAGNQQASGVYAQGSSVGGGAYLEQPQEYLKDGPEPADEPEIASADAEASPAAPESEAGDIATEEEHEAPEQQEQDPKKEQEESADQPQGNSDTELEKPGEQEPAVPQHVSHRPSKGHTKKGKKIPLPPPPAVEDDDEEDEEDEDDDDVPYVPSKPGKGRKNKHYPSLNNFFPMVFTIPRGTGRRGSSVSSGSIPGMITAIANSYSTGKGGVASSVATAYGGSPTKKQRRTSPTK